MHQIELNLKSKKNKQKRKGEVKRAKQMIHILLSMNTTTNAHFNKSILHKLMITSLNEYMIPFNKDGCLFHEMDGWEIGYFMIDPSLPQLRKKT